MPAVNRLGCYTVECDASGVPTHVVLVVAVVVAERAFPRAFLASDGEVSGDRDNGEQDEQPGCIRDERDPADSAVQATYIGFRLNPEGPVVTSSDGFSMVIVPAARIAHASRRMIAPINVRPVIHRSVQSDRLHRDPQGHCAHQ